MLLALALVLLLLWALGFMNHVGGDLIHLLIVLAVIGFLAEAGGGCPPAWRGRRRGDP